MFVLKVPHFAGAGERRYERDKCGKPIGWFAAYTDRLTYLDRLRPQFTALRGAMLEVTRNVLKAAGQTAIDTQSLADFLSMLEQEEYDEAIAIPAAATAEAVYLRLPGNQVREDSQAKVRRATGEETPPSLLPPPPLRLPLRAAPVAGQVLSH